MTRLQNDRAALFLVIGVLAVLVVLGLYVVSYSRRHVASLAAEPAYGSPRDAMIRWQREHGAVRVEITHAGRVYPLLKNLWRVEADVWLDDHDAPKIQRQFFLRTRRGWVLVPEGRHPGVMALGQSLLSIVAPQGTSDSALGRPGAPYARQSVDRFSENGSRSS